MSMNLQSRRTDRAREPDDSGCQGSALRCDRAKPDRLRVAVRASAGWNGARGSSAGRIGASRKRRVGAG
jgi:hypothetical protein